MIAFVPYVECVKRERITHIMPGKVRRPLRMRHRIDPAGAIRSISAVIGHGKSLVQQVVAEARHRIIPGSADVCQNTIASAKSFLDAISIFFELSTRVWTYF